MTLTSEESVRLEPVPGPMTIEAPAADRAYSPFHMLGGALAYCTYSILASWASHAGLDTDRLVIDVAWTFGEEPHRVASMRVNFEWPELPANRRAAAKRVAALCAVHATLTHSPSITIDLAGPSAAPAAPTAAASHAPAGNAPALEQRDVTAGADGLAR